MKKLLALFIAIVLVSVILPFGCRKKSISKIELAALKQEKLDIDIQWKEPAFKPSIKPYSVKSDLSNVINGYLLTGLGESDKNELAKNSFLIKKADALFEQPFNVYEKNGDDNIPNFITTDSVLHVYHLIYDEMIKNIEDERMYDELKSFTEESFRKSLEIYNGINQRDAKKAALKNIAYFGIAMRLMEISLPGGIPLEANRIIDNDVKRIRSRWNSGTSEIFPYYIDYRRYTTSGHYYRDTDLRNYFLTMMWYGNTPLLFDMYDQTTNTYKRMDEQIAMSVIMTCEILGEENLRKQWDDIYKVTSLYFGKANDVTIYDMSDIIKVIYGDKVDFNKIWSEDRIKKVYELAGQRYNLYSTETIGARISYSDKTNIHQVQFRLMGQIYNLDTDLFRNLTYSSDTTGETNRLFPNGLDIPAAFGSNRAYNIIKSGLDDKKSWNGYPENIERLREILTVDSGDVLKDYALNNSTYWILKGFTKSVGSGYPAFMMSPSWKDKNLLTWVSTIGDTKHSSVLTSKSGEVKTNPDSGTVNSDIPGYVEPNVYVYERIEYAGKTLKAFLTAGSFTGAANYNMVDSLIDMANFLKTISIKELEDKAFTKDEDIMLRNYAKELKSMTMNAVESKGSIKQWETVQKVDRNMAVISDLYSYDNQTVQSAVGNPDYIYVIVPYKGKLYFTRGSVYTYYELEPSSRRLTDSEWQSMLRDGRAPNQQDWITDIRK